jgi:hypothetical protein
MYFYIKPKKKHLEKMIYDIEQDADLFLFR